MKKMSLLIALIGLVMVLSGCITTPPAVNEKAQATKSGVLQYKHMVYIPIHADEQLGQTGALLQDVDTWIDNNPQKTVISVVMVNATQENVYGGYSHTTTSGALIVFENKESTEKFSKESVKKMTEELMKNPVKKPN